MHHRAPHNEGTDIFCFFHGFSPPLPSLFGVFLIPSCYFTFDSKPLFVIHFIDHPPVRLSGFDGDLDKRLLPDGKHNRVLFI
jgi:hypothetical protein